MLEAIVGGRYLSYSARHPDLRRINPSISSKTLLHNSKNLALYNCVLLDSTHILLSARDKREFEMHIEDGQWFYHHYKSTHWRK